MPLAAVVPEDEAAHFIARVVEEDHSRRARVGSLDDLAVRDAWMLAFLIGNHHPEPAVLFHDVDALDIDLLEPWFPVLNGKGCNKGSAEKRGQNSVDLQEAHFLLNPGFHGDLPSRQHATNPYRGQ